MIISTVAGNGTSCAGTADRAMAASRQRGILLSERVSVDSGGNLYVADSSDYRIRKVTTAVLLQARKRRLPSSPCRGNLRNSQIATITDSTPAPLFTSPWTAPRDRGLAWLQRPINVSGTVTIKAIAIAPAICKARDYRRLYHYLSAHEPSRQSPETALTASPELAALQPAPAWVPFIPWRWTPRETSTRPMRQQRGLDGVR